MESKTLLPDKKLLLKNTLVLITISAFLLLVGLTLQLLLPLDPSLTAAKVARTLWPIVVAVIIAIWIISFPLIVVWIKHLKYEIMPERVTIHKGIISRVEQNIPYKAITDFSLHRSLYDRLLGISSVRIQTAGQSPTSTGYEGILAGLVNGGEVLEELRTKVKDAQMNMPLDQKQEDVMPLILEELKKIRKILESRNAE
jgi:uncharacterized membrane protein YdbT with pleckstrin-like domain